MFTKTLNTLFMLTGNEKFLEENFDPNNFNIFKMMKAAIVSTDCLKYLGRESLKIMVEHILSISKRF